MILVIGAMAILSMLTLSINTSILQTYVASYDSQASIDAMSIGQSMIDEIVSPTNEFDSLTWNTHNISNPALFTTSSRLGPDLDSEITFFNSIKSVGDTAPFKSLYKYNDVDDFNGYYRIVKSPDLGNFYVRDSVYYVLPSGLDTYSASQTYFKAIRVTVSHPNLYRPVVLKSLIVFRRYLVY